MKKEYTKPELEIVNLEVEDIITDSSKSFGNALPGDKNVDFDDFWNQNS